jgi:predicted protein tyrosine phosphatase
MIKGNKNQLANVGNHFQGDAEKVLVVCSAGLLRSPTVANALHKHFGYNTRAVGSCKDFALIPITQALIWWADEIVFVNWDNWEELDQDEKDEIESVGLKKVILDIPDDYNYGDPELERFVINQYILKESV